MRQAAAAARAQQRAQHRNRFLHAARRPAFAETAVRVEGLAFDTATGRNTVGRMTVSCQHCGALHWEGESVGGSGKFSMCCQQGKVQLPPLQPTPPLLQRLLSADSEEGRHFVKNSRAYKQCVAAGIDW